MEHILVTGGCGTVGSEAVRELVSLDCRVILSDLGTPDHQRQSAHHEGSDLVTVDWCDLTDAGEVDELVEATAPDAVVHLAALIPPASYATPELARAVNVDGTRHLVDACERATIPPRLVLASSIAVHGPRNPHAGLGPLTPDTPTNPRDNYGRHKVEAEEIVRSSSLDHVILRLGAVIGAAMSTSGQGEALHLSALLPNDGNIQTIDMRDAVRACAAAVRADVVGQTLLIGGDETHRRKQADIGDLLAAMGLEDALPAGRPGDPADDDGWFTTDWMDTTASQAALDYQRVSWPTMLDDARENAGLKRHLYRLAAPVLNAVLTRRDPYRDLPGEYADPWAGVVRKWGPAALEP